VLLSGSIEEPRAGVQISFRWKPGWPRLPPLLDGPEHWDRQEDDERWSAWSGQRFAFDKWITCQSVWQRAISELLPGGPGPAGAMTRPWRRNSCCSGYGPVVECDPAFAHQGVLAVFAPKSVIGCARWAHPSKRDNFELVGGTVPIPTIRRRDTASAGGVLFS
jgi:hypothetical protein